jgi:trans-4-hydroxy-L-proline dehydratase
MGCIETGTEVWNGGANYYTVAQISVGGVDAANSLMAVKHLVFDKKKLTMAELKKALAANFEGRIREGPQDVLRGRAEARQRHPGSEQDAPQGERQHPEGLQQRRWRRQLHQQGHQDLARPVHQECPQPDGHGDRRLPNGKKAGVALTDGSLSAMPGTDVNGPDRAGDVCREGNDAIKWCATHMNMKLPPDQLKTRKGRDNVMNLVRPCSPTGLSHPVQRAGYRNAQGRAEAPGEVPRPRGPGGRVQRVLHQTARGRAERDHRTDRSVVSDIQRAGTAWRSVTPYRKFVYKQ